MGKEVAGHPANDGRTEIVAQDVQAGSLRAILLRDPITIEWDELRAIAGRERLMGFDFGAQALAQREALTAPKGLHRFVITRDGDDIVFTLDALSCRLDVAGLHPLHEHLLLKMLLNAHSTLLMGRIGRFESNVMTWVKPSNNKLIDRAIGFRISPEDETSGVDFSQHAETAYAEGVHGHAAPRREPPR